VKAIVYRVQPAGAKLHGKRSRTSGDEFVNGVFVFSGFGSIGLGDFPSLWRNVELVKIVCDEKDLWDPGDVQGYVLRRGKGKIVERIAFKTLWRLREWVESLQKLGLEW